MITETDKIIQFINLGVKQRKFARYVYKYRPINAFTEKIFENSALWFSNPKTFNDPFDCQIVTQTKNSQLDIERFLQENSPNIGIQEIKGLAKAMRNKPADWNKMVNGSINSIINSSGICCFAGSNDNILMWSHYTDSHKGICLKFDLLADPNLFILPLKIKYSNDYPYYNHLQDSSKITECLFQTKAECWSYENEFRVIKQETGNYKFEKKALVEIAFGCNTNQDDIKNIKDLLIKNKFSNVKLTKAHTSDSTFQLLIRDII